MQMASLMQGNTETRNSNIWSVATARLVDQLSQTEFAVPATILMEHAGKAVAQRIASDFPMTAEVPGRKRARILALAGPEQWRRCLGRSVVVAPLALCNRRLFNQ